MGRVRELPTVRWPSAPERYDQLSEATFRMDLERHLDLFAGEIFAAGAFMLTFDNGDTTPSVARADIYAEANTAPTSVTAFDDGAVGQRITIIFSTANTTLVDAAALQLAGGVNFVGSANDVMELIFDGTAWYEISRSVN